jgi:phosphoglycerate kinase
MPTAACVTPDVQIPKDQMALDIGPKTVAQLKQLLKGVETIFWNGPLGAFEEPTFSRGTFKVASIVAASAARKLAGGGDIAAAIAQSGLEKRFDFISTGGGATLEFLEGRELPGLKVLEITRRSDS